MIVVFILLIIIIVSFLIYLKCCRPLYLRIFVLNLLSTLFLIWLPLLLVFYYLNTPVQNLFFRKELTQFNDLNLLKEIDLEPLKSKLFNAYSQILDELKLELEI